MDGMDRMNNTEGRQPASMATVAAVVLTKNEESNIADCLRSVSWVDEIIVVDSGSTDNTCAIAREYTDNVMFHPWAGFSAQRNYADSFVKSDWILCLAADERVSPGLQAEIAAQVKPLPADDPVVAYRIPIRDWMFGKFVNYGMWPHQKHVRLYRRGKAQWVGTVHEWPEVAGESGLLTQPILHYSHLTVARFIEKLNTYTELEANEMFARGQRANLATASLGAIRAFLGQYVRLQGFRDGGHGLILAVLMAVYFFVTRAKLWSRWYMQEHGGGK